MILVCDDRIGAGKRQNCPTGKCSATGWIDNLDLQAAAERGIAVRNLPDEVTYSTAELAVALMLACMRRLGEADRLVRSTNPLIEAHHCNGRNCAARPWGLLALAALVKRLLK